jgi:hypothetical protein
MAAVMQWSRMRQLNNSTRILLQMALQNAEAMQQGRMRWLYIYTIVS